MVRKSERVGAMREQITIQAVTESRSASGHVTESWATYATVWASVKYNLTNSDEEEKADRKTAVGTVQFTTRYDGAVTEKHRIGYTPSGGSATVYDIMAITVSPDLFYMTLEAQKRV